MAGARGIRIAHDGTAKPSGEIKRVIRDLRLSSHLWGRWVGLASSELESESDSDSDSDSGDALSDLSSEDGSVDGDAEAQEEPMNVKHVKEMVSKLDSVLEVIFRHLDRLHHA